MGLVYFEPGFDFEDIIFLPIFTTSYDFLLSLAPIITLQFNLISSRTVYFPIPEFPPVTIAYFPVKSYFDVSNFPPHIHFLNRYNTTIIIPKTVKYEINLFSV